LIGLKTVGFVYMIEKKILNADDFISRHANVEILSIKFDDDTCT